MREGSFKVQYFYLAFWSAVLCLFFAALQKYEGSAWIYIVFSLLCNLLLTFGFRKNRIFFDTFIGLYFWLGFWLKFSIHTAFGWAYTEPIGDFALTAEGFNSVLGVSSCAFAALLLASLLRGRYFNYTNTSSSVDFTPLYQFYVKYRRKILTGFILLVLAVAASNAYWGIYQRGCAPRITLRFGLGGIYTWLLLFGFSSVSAVLLNFEIKTRTSPYLVMSLGMMECFLSNVSMLSRGMLLNVSSLLFGLAGQIKKQAQRFNTVFWFTSIGLFIILFAGSMVLSNYARVFAYANESIVSYSPARPMHKYTRMCTLVDRWVGLEGVMAVAGYNKRGLDLLKTAMAEKYITSGTSFYDTHIIKDSSYKDIEAFKHFVTLPGIIAFFFYTGSYMFVFFAMLLVGIIGWGIEWFAFKFGGSNLVLCALIGQVAATRFAHFGYAPARSHILFLAIVFEVLILFGLNKVIALSSRR